MGDYQLTLKDLPSSKPDYHGRLDEISRLSTEIDFENSIKLRKCPVCGKKPTTYFKSCHEYFLRCACNLETKHYRHTYEAMQAWNRGETFCKKIKDKK